MKKFLTILILSFFVIGAIPSAVFAARPEKAGKPKPPSDGGGTTEMVGYDISYPQCGRNLPTDHYFGIVGVNGGNAATANPCLADQLVWQSKARDGSNQSKLQLYVNTANPAQYSLYDWKSWPKSGDTPYGLCTGANDIPCSWLYGWNRSIYTEGVFKSAAESKGLNSNTSDYIWWLDVETMNSWQAGSSDALARNHAAIEGFAAFYQSKNAKVGLYSTEYQWSEIVGKTIISEGNLVGLPNWRPSGASLSNAINNCGVSPLTTGGKIVLTQYVKKNLDHNHSCL
jgi:hypothetical protein